VVARPAEKAPARTTKLVSAAPLPLSPLFPLLLLAAAPPLPLYPPM
jgi:hypothetical protein